MRCRLTALVACLPLALAHADVVDRIVAAVNNRAIKESQIDRDIRLTDFLNGVPLDESAASKRKAADRLIDQTVIRTELAKGTYPAPSDADYQQALKTYGISEPELKAQIAFQLQVVKFVDLRFAKGSLKADNDAFFAWLDATRKASRIQYHDEVLQ